MYTYLFPYIYIYKKNLEQRMLLISKDSHPQHSPGKPLAPVAVIKATRSRCGKDAQRRERGAET